MKSARAYTQTLRARQVAENEARILDAGERLFTTLPYDEVTLAAIAHAAGVTIPTVQRRFGSKEDVFFAAGVRVRARIEARRGTPAPGDVDGALRALLQHYDVDGDATWHFLGQEASSPPIAKVLAGARAMHREWVERVFAEALARVAGSARRRLADGLFAATDLFVWKLLRRDLGRTRAEVFDVMRTTVNALLESPPR
jgi:AcrR family transcriptional regulator